MLTRAQVRTVDQLAVRELRIPSIILMENAGRNAADWIMDRYADCTGAVVFGGCGNNGGDGLVIARHLHNAGWTVRVVVAGDPSRLSHDARVNYDVIAAMGMTIRVVGQTADIEPAAGLVQPTDLIVDALLGTGFRGRVRPPMAELITQLNQCNRRAVVAVDVPSGLDCDTGGVENIAVRADATVTFVATKPGLVSDRGAAYAGEVVVRDIGAPPVLIARVGKTVTKASSP